jgi:hypothetical protein
MRCWGPGSCLFMASASCCSSCLTRSSRAAVLDSSVGGPEVLDTEVVSEDPMPGSEAAELAYRRPAALEED